MSQIFKPYSEIPIILEQAAKKNLHLAMTLRDYILQFSSDFDNLKERLIQLTNDPLVATDKKADKKDDEEFHSELFKAFPDIAVNHLLQIKSYKFAAHELKKFACRRIEESAKEYTQRNEALSKKFISELTFFETVRKENDDAQFKMKDAEVILFTAEKEGKEDLEPLKQAYLQERKRAHAVYQECTQKTDDVTKRMEELLTQFENLEIWHSDELKEILSDFASTLMRIANNFVFASSLMNEAVSEIPIELDSHVIARFDQFRPAETDEFFQVWAVNPLASKFLSRDTLFKKEIENGGQLFEIKEDYKGPAGHLNGHEGELVCGMEIKGDCIYCKNINECVGLLPKKILVFPK